MPASLYTSAAIKLLNTEYQDSAPSLLERSESLITQVACLLHSMSVACCHHSSRTESGKHDSSGGLSHCGNIMRDQQRLDCIQRRRRGNSQQINSVLWQAASQIGSFMGPALGGIVADLAGFRYHFTAEFMLPMLGMTSSQVRAAGQSEQHACTHAYLHLHRRYVVAIF